MAELYHFSHFFEFLCGVYFGGFALLGFFENNGLREFSSLISERATRVSLTSELIKLKATPLRSKNFKYLFIGLFWFFFASAEVSAFGFFKSTSIFILASNSRKENELIKRFFPSFFFGGCFCLAIIALSAFQFENKNHILYQTIVHFQLNYGVSCLIFQIWALVFFPPLVNKFDYFHLTFINLCICCLLVILSFELAYHKIDYLGLGWPLKDWINQILLLALICVSLMPLAFIFGMFGMLFFFWEITTIFYSVSLRFLQKNIETEIKDDIDKLGENF